MCKSYKEKIQTKIDILSKMLPIDTEIQVSGKIPTSVSSEFITNREQGDWAERVVSNAINQNENYIAVKYGRSEELSAGDDGFKEFYSDYQNELNNIGKLPDLLVFKKADYFPGIEKDDDGIKKAICAIEVRSSSFLIDKYNNFMIDRNHIASNKIETLREKIFNSETLNSLLLSKNKVIYDILKNSTIDEFKNGATFKFRKLSSTPDLVKLSEILKEIKDNIKIIQKRDYLSITPKLEDIALVNRWIQHFDVPHYYLQVFFDKAYIISFDDILNLSSDHNNEGRKFSIEKDTKNQGKTTIKIDVNTQESKLIIDEISMPRHYSNMKELDRGRLLFYIKFDDSNSKLSNHILEEVFNEYSR